MWKREKGDRRGGRGLGERREGMGEKDREGREAERSDVPTL